MMRRNTVVCGVLAAIVVFAGTGCTSYYRVSDPQTSKVYYTKSIRKSGGAGYVEFKDADTGAMVTLQSSEIATISQYEFDKETK